VSCVLTSSARSSLRRAASRSDRDSIGCEPSYFDLKKSGDG